MNSDKKVYSVLELAKVLGISRNFAYGLVRSGEIKSVKLGEKRIVIPVSEVERMLDR